jgi:hypothetical protein
VEKTSLQPESLKVAEREMRGHLEAERTAKERRQQNVGVAQSSGRPRVLPPEEKTEKGRRQQAMGVAQSSLRRRVLPPFEPI